MRKIILIGACMFALSSIAFGANKSSKFRVDELILLPHPNKVLKSHAKELGVTKQELQRIKKEVKAVYPPLFQKKIQKAFTIEKKVRRMVYKGKTKTDVKPYLDEIEKLKREAMDIRIDALNEFRKILGHDKWMKIVNYKQK